MTSVNDVRVELMKCVDKVLSGGGAAAQALEDYKVALAALSRAGEGTTQDDFASMQGELAWIIEQLETILGKTHTTKDGVYEIDKRL